MDTDTTGPQSSCDHSPRSSRENSNSDNEFFFESHMNLAPMPDVPPPPPPTDHGQDIPQYHHAGNSNIVEKAEQGEGDVEGTRMDPMKVSTIHSAGNSNIPVDEIVEQGEGDSNGIDHPIKVSTIHSHGHMASIPSGEMPLEVPPPVPPSSKRKKEKAAKKSKKKKKDKEKKDKKKVLEVKSLKSKSKSRERKSRSKSRSYSEYNSSAKDKNGHNIVHYESEEGENGASLFSFCKPNDAAVGVGVGIGVGKATGSVPAWNKNGPTIANFPTPKIGARRRMRGINTGVANSAAGEGTTVPQLLSKMRFFTFLLSALTIAFEVWAMFFNVVFLQGDKVVLGAYLLFFVGLLLLYEFVRGSPVPESNTSISLEGIVRKGSINLNAAQVAELVWTLVLEKRWARQLRYFLQNNFGILYSCVGKGIFLCFVGSVAIGQKFIMIEIVGFGFVIFGMWTISLRFRYPYLEKAMVMDLESEFGEEDDSSVAGESAVSWTSIHSSIRSNNEERRSLLSKHGLG